MPLDVSADHGADSVRSSPPVRAPLRLRVLSGVSILVVVVPLILVTFETFPTRPNGDPWNTRGAERLNAGHPRTRYRRAIGRSSSTSVLVGAVAVSPLIAVVWRPFALFGDSAMVACGRGAATALYLIWLLRRLVSPWAIFRWRRFRPRSCTARRRGMRSPISYRCSPFAILLLSRWARGSAHARPARPSHRVQGDAGLWLCPRAREFVGRRAREPHRLDSSCHVVGTNPGVRFRCDRFAANGRRRRLPARSVSRLASGRDRHDAREPFDLPVHLCCCRCYSCPSGAPALPKADSSICGAEDRPAMPRGESRVGESTGASSSDRSVGSSSR
jgi:hypothetical protein